MAAVSLSPKGSSGGATVTPPSVGGGGRDDVVPLSLFWGVGVGRAFPFDQGGTGGLDDPLLVRGAELNAPRALPLAPIGPEERVIW